LKRKDRITLFVVIAMLLCFLMSLSSGLSAQEAPAPKRLLVLGFRSQVFDQVQERYLREALLRLLIRGGCGAVPVMEMESAMEGKAVNVTRDFSGDSIRETGKRFSADVVVYGYLKPANRRGMEAVSEEGSYECRLCLLDMESGEVKNFTYAVKGEANWHLFYTGLAERMAADIMPACGK
jgi:hypothetical protein